MDYNNTLKSIVLPKTFNQLLDGNFRNFIVLEEFNVPIKITKIPNDCFMGSSFASFNLPNTITTIGASAFAHCDNLTEISIPNSVTSIEYDAFDSCENLNSVTIPPSLTNIGNSAFTCCNSLTNINIPNSITVLNDYLFSFCSSLKTITIPISVTNIGVGVFQGCKSLATVNYEGTMAQWNNITKSDDWNGANYSWSDYRALFSVVHCSDGDVTVKS